MEMATRRRLQGVELHLHLQLTYEQRIQYLKAAQFSVNGRMHPFVISKIFGNASVPIEYTHKVSSILDKFPEIEGTDLCRLIKSPKGLLGAMNREYDTPSSLGVEPEKLIKTAKQNFEWI